MAKNDAEEDLSENDEKDNRTTGNENNTDERSEKEHDESISELIARIDEQDATIEQLGSELASVRELLTGHETGFKHERVPEPTGGELEPAERHWYFRTVGR